MEHKDTEYKETLYKLAKKTLKKIDDLSEKLSEVHGEKDESDLIWFIASDFIATIDFDRMAAAIERDNFYLLKSSGCLEWMSGGELNNALWEGNRWLASESFQNFLKNIILFREKYNILKFEIEGEEIEINLDSSEDTKLFEDLYKLIKEEAMKNNEHRSEIEKELVLLKEKINELQDKTKKIEEEQFRNDIQSIFDSIISISGPIGSAIMAIYKSTKSGVKYITTSQKINLD